MRGSKLMAARSVSITTTAAKQTIPGPGATVAIFLKADERHQNRGDEDVDHGPASNALDEPEQARPRCRPSRASAVSMLNSKVSSTTIFKAGTTMLARNTMSGYGPVSGRLPWRLRSAEILFRPESRPRDTKRDDRQGIRREHRAALAAMSKAQVLR